MYLLLVNMHSSRRFTHGTNLSDNFFTVHYIHIQNVFADEYLKKCPILVLGNKIDRPGALSESELKIALQISVCFQWYEYYSFIYV